VIAGYCSVQYDGKGQPGHIAAGFRLKGNLFESGKPAEVSAEVAGLLLKSAPVGSVKVLEGQPADVVVQPAVAKAAAKSAARLAAEHAARFPVAPDDALTAVDALPDAILKAVSGKDEDALAFVASGKADKALGHLALWAKLGRRDKLAAAAVLRSGVLATGAATS
jgi:hypothetical protein